MTNTMETTTQLGALVADKMEEMGLTINDLKLLLDVTYEHARRIVRGESVPSKHVLYLMADAFQIPRETVVRLATADKLQKKYGSIPLELAGGDPTLEPIKRDWTKLSEHDKETVMDMVRNLARRNKLAK
jgi:transcriptional regulator with XRE-family HTH domain